MNEPRLTLIGVVTDPPQLNHTQKAHLPVANLWVSCTDRVFNREQRRWQQGSTLRMKVVCWRDLAENVAASVRRGDPVLVTGTLRTRQYQDRSGRRVTGYEVTAASVGPDLNRGTASFARTRPTIVELPDAGPTVDVPPVASATLGVAALAAVGAAPAPHASGDEETLRSGDRRPPEPELSPEETSPAAEATRSVASSAGDASQFVASPTGDTSQPVASPTGDTSQPVASPTGDTSQPVASSAGETAATAETSMTTDASAAMEAFVTTDASASEEASDVAEASASDEASVMDNGDVRGARAA